MDIPRNWRLNKQRLLLLGEVCENGHPSFPPRPRCLDCREDEVDEVGNNGKEGVLGVLALPIIEELGLSSEDHQQSEVTVEEGGVIFKAS